MKFASKSIGTVGFGYHTVLFIRINYAFVRFVRAIDFERCTLVSQKNAQCNLHYNRNHKKLFMRININTSWLSVPGNSASVIET